MHGRCLLRVLRVVAGVAERNEVAVHIGKLRIFIRRLDVVNLCGFPHPSELPAVSAHVSVSPENLLALSFPARRVVIKLHVASDHPQPLRYHLHPATDAKKVPAPQTSA